MNRKLILQLSLFGLFMAFATVFWIPSALEPACWLIIFLICAYLIAKKCKSKYFLHGFFVSLLNSVWITSIHLLFFDSYIFNHTQVIELMSGLPVPYSPRISMLLLGPVFGAASGIILGLFSLIASRIIKK